LLLAGVYAFDSPRPFVRSALSAILIALACLTKQVALIMGLFLCAEALITRKREERLAFPLLFGILTGGSFLAFQIFTNGWFSYYVFSLLSQHAILKEMFLSFWTKDIALHMWPALCIAIFALTLNKKRLEIIHNLVILGGLLLISYSSRLHDGGFDNVLMPAYAGISIYFGMGFATLFKITTKKSLHLIFLTSLAALQFILLIYNPWTQIPLPESNADGQRLLQLISSFPGEVYIPNHPWFTGALGKPTQAQYMAIWDIVRASGSNQWKSSLYQEMNRDVSNQRYDAFITDSEGFLLEPPNFNQYYMLANSHLITDRTFCPVVAACNTPMFLYIRRPLICQPNL
jgi:hypothetical protein